MNDPRNDVVVRRIADEERVLNVLPSPGTERDWTFEDAVGANAFAAAAPGALPAKVDLRADWWEVGDQGSTGSCVGWATADAVIRYHLVRAGKLEKDERLSTRFQWMASKETDQYTSRPSSFLEVAGTWIKAALDVARAYGTVPDDLLPFASGALARGSETTFYATAAQRRIASYHNLQLDPGQWRRWLASNGPIAVALNCDDAFFDASAANPQLDVYVAPPGWNGHACALVGYDGDRFTIRNSWGERWGDGGFAYASTGYCLAAFQESYGVTV
jgi:C1A family cysteine protease